MDARLPRRLTLRSLAVYRNRDATQDIKTNTRNQIIYEVSEVYSLHSVLDAGGWLKETQFTVQFTVTDATQDTNQESPIQMSQRGRCEL